MKNKYALIIILEVLCFMVSIISFTKMYNLLCEMNPDNNVAFSLYLCGGLITLIVGVYFIIDSTE